MAFTIVTIYLTEGHAPVQITGDQVAEYFAITPAIKTRPDGSVTLSDHGRCLTHIPSGRAVTSSGFLDLRRYAEELAKLPIDWARLTSARDLTEEQAKQVKAIHRELSFQDDAEWPWPAWAGDESRPALSLLGQQLDDALKYGPRRELAREFQRRLTDTQLDPELAREIDNRLLLADIGEHVNGYGLIYLLAVLQRLDPESADKAARHLVGAWEAGDSMGEWIYDWRRQLADGQPLTLHEFPDLSLLTEVSA